MPLETATYIAGLVPSNPAASDGMNNADDHMRLIKSAVQNSFPSIAGAVTATHTDLNNVVAQFAGTKVYNAPLGLVATPGYAFLGDLDTGMWSPGANQLAFSVGGVQALAIAADKSATFAGAVSAANLTGPGSVPIGGMIMWLSDTLPTGSGVWCWANGGTLSRTAAGAGLELFTVWGGAAGGGLRYGVGDGTTTFNVPNLQEVVPVGKSTMGGATSPAKLPNTANIATLGASIGVERTTLTSAHVPEHDHAVFLKDPGHTHGGSYANSVFGAVSDSTPGSVQGSYSAVTIPSAFTGMTIGSVSGTANDNKTAKYGTASPTPVPAVQPSLVVNYIIRVA